MKFSGMVLILLASSLMVHSQQSTDLEKLVETERAFARAALEKGMKAAFLEYLADDGVIFQPAAVNGKEFWKNQPESPALLSWEPVWADIRGDGMLGYTTGPWEYRPKGKDDEPVAFGQYVTIWKKQNYGGFKAVLDIGIYHRKQKGKIPALALPKDAGSNGDPADDRVINDKNQFAFPGWSTEKFADDIRIYRDGDLPFSGITASEEKAFAEAKRNADEKASDVKCFGSNSITYCFGVTATRDENGKDECANHLRIWRSRAGKWFIVLDLRSPIPEFPDCGSSIQTPNNLGSTPPNQ